VSEVQGPDRLAVVGAAVAVTSWGSAGVVVKHISMGGLALGAYRFGLYALLIVVWLAARRSPLTWRALRASVPGGLALSADVALFFTAVKHTTIVNATVIGALQPVVLGVVGARFFGERISRRSVVLAAVALAGVVAIVGASSSSDEWSLAGDLAAVGSLVGWSVYFVCSKRSRGVVSPTEFTAGTGLVTAVVCLVFAPVFGQDLSLPTADDWVWIVVLMLGAGLVGHSLMNWSLVRIPLWLGSVLTLFIPVVSALLAWVALGEGLDTVQIAGMVLVVVALALIVTEPAGTDDPPV
jgi:drug/metabolite transporter (DMT)-like permease